MTMMITQTCLQSWPKSLNSFHKKYLMANINPLITNFKPSPSMKQIRMVQPMKLSELIQETSKLSNARLRRKSNMMRVAPVTKARAHQQVQSPSRLRKQMGITTLINSIRVVRWMFRSFMVVDLPIKSTLWMQENSTYNFLLEHHTQALNQLLHNNPHDNPSSLSAQPTWIKINKLILAKRSSPKSKKGSWTSTFHLLRTVTCSNGWNMTTTSWARWSPKRATI